MYIRNTNLRKFNNPYWRQWLNYRTNPSITLKWLPQVLQDKNQTTAIWTGLPCKLLYHTCTYLYSFNGKKIGNWIPVNGTPPLPHDNLKIHCQYQIKYKETETWHVVLHIEDPFIETLEPGIILVEEFLLHCDIGKKLK